MRSTDGRSVVTSALTARTGTGSLGSEFSSASSGVVFWQPPHGKHKQSHQNRVEERPATTNAHQTISCPVSLGRLACLTYLCPSNRIIT